MGLSSHYIQDPATGLAYPGSAYFNLRADWRCHENVMEKSGKRFQQIWLVHFDRATAVALLGPS